MPLSPASPPEAPPGDSTRVRQLVAGIGFAALALALASVVPTAAIAWVCAILLFIIYLFAFEVVGVDVAAATVMVLLGLTDLLWPFMGLQKQLLDTEHLFAGFSSNAVISIIAVMIIGAGLDRTGIMSRVAGIILKVGGRTEARIVPIISASVGAISSFMQNVGAAALFLPVVARISARSGLPMSRLLMPMGFCAILGGTMTLVGSSPLILLNDLIMTSNQGLPPEQQVHTWGLFSVTPVGLALVAAGILYFVLAGRLVLPVATQDNPASAADPINYFRDLYGVDYSLTEVQVPAGSPLVGKALDDIESRYRIRVIATRLRGAEGNVGPGTVARDTRITADMTLGVIADPADLECFIDRHGLKWRAQLSAFADDLSPHKAGIAELVIPPRSKLVGKSARDIWMRKTYGLAMIALHRNGQTLREGDDIRNMPLQAGDALVCHTPWLALERVEKDRDFLVVTTEFPHAEEVRPNKVGWALLFFLLALSLVLFTDVRLSVALLTGAIGMVWAGVLKIEEAYQAVSWKTVFLLASLIPLGLAVEVSGTAKWVAGEVVELVGAAAPWVIQACLAALATFFTLVMSNVGATVLLVPLAVNIAIQVGADPAVYALIVVLATSNSFLIPTHQVNALIMGPGGYRVRDFLRAGGIMTVLFLVVLIAVVNLVY